VDMAPFFDSSPHACGSDSTELHKGDGSKRTERLFLCFFGNFFVFWRLLGKLFFIVTHHVRAWIQ